MHPVEFYEQVERYARPRMLENLAKLSLGEFTREIPTTPRGSKGNILAHTMECEEYWIQFRLMNGAEPALNQFENYPTLFSVGVKWAEVAKVTKGYLQGLTETDLNAAREHVWGDGEVARYTVAQAIYHVLTHEFHHKGQLMLLMR